MEASSVKKYQFEQFSATRLYTPLVAYSPDGRTILHANNATGQFNLWTVPSGGGFARQLTSYTENTLRSAMWSPDGKQILFTADHNGDEQHQIYILGAAGGWAEALTDAPKVQHFIIDPWSPNGKTIAYAANDRTPTQQDVLLRNLATGETTRPFPPLGLLFPAMWSPDGRYLTVAQVTSNTNQTVWLHDTQTGENVEVTPHEGEIIYFPGPWAPDGSGFYIVTDEGREFKGLAFYRLADKSRTWVETPERDVENVVVSKNGEALVWAVNEDGASKLYGRNLKTGAALKLPDLLLGVVGNMDISPDGKRLAMVFVRPVEASNLYEVDLQTGKMEARGQSMLGGIDPNDLPNPELVHFPTFDGKQIPAWLYKPSTGQAPYPVILSIHGGPEAQERPSYSYNGFYQYMLSRGFAILAPNIRGSTGYGKTYQKLIHRDWGGAELKDIEHAAKYLQRQEWVDKNRMVVFGGSFGGFATLSAATRLPQYWAAAIDLVGPANLLTFVKAVPPTWRFMMKAWVGDPEEDHDLLVERSPITYVDNLKAPILIIQGANDPRVVKAESDQMVERIKQNGGDVTYYVDEAEGHGTTKRENTLKWYRMISEYLEERLLDEPVAEPV